MQLNRKGVSIISAVATGHFFSIDPSVFKRNVTSKKINLVYSLLPIYYFSRVMGLLPFSITRDSHGKVHEARVSVFDFFWFVASISFYIFLAAFCYLTMKVPNDPNVSLILIIGDNVLLIFGLIYGAISIAMDMYNRHRLVEILKMLTAFDEEVANLGFYMDYKKRRRRVFIWYSGTVVLSFLLAFSTFMIIHKNLSDYPKYAVAIYFCIYVYQRIITAIILTTYFILIFNLFYRFQALNTLLSKKFLRKKGARLRIDMQKDESIAYIKFFGLKHDYLTGIMEKLNYCYSLQVMFNIGATFIFSVLTFYTFYRYILQPNEFFERLTRIHLDYQIFYVIYTQTVIYAGSIITREGKRTSELVHNIINRCDDADLNVSLAQMSQQIQHRYPLATCGLFVFNWTLLYTMIGAVTTYLTILVQFDTPHGLRNRN